MAGKRNDKTFQLALSGICLAFSVILIFAGSMVPGIEMTCFALAGIVLGCVILETGVKGGVMLYVGAVLLSLVLVPNKLGIVPYLLFFGTYPFAKFFGEKIKNPAGQICMKLVFSMVILGGAYLFLEDIFFAGVDLPQIAAVLMVPAFGIMSLLYDYIFTLALSIYRQRVKRENIGFKLSGDKNGDEKR